MRNSNSIKLFLSLSLLFFISLFRESVIFADSPPVSTKPSSFTVVPFSEINWEQLNPARGESSPRAGTLWGNRNGVEPTGFLAQFIDGFSSPPHIHNATYRAVVISGHIHNDDPSAEKMWMPPGSFWTQPKGEAHITAARGERNMALVEIDAGPYLVRPVEEAFDSGERPINVDPSNLVWQVPGGYSLGQTSPRIAYLWGQPQADADNGTFLELPEGFSGKIISHSSYLRAVVINGVAEHVRHAESSLEPGSYFGSEGPFRHEVSTETGVVLYIRTAGTYEIQ